MLTKQRNEWAQKFEAGERPALLEAYEEIRNSELGRLSTQVEKLAEYALYLEYKIRVSNHDLTLCSVCNKPVTEPHYQCIHAASNTLISQALRAWKTGEKK
jgi:hypothetical protein